MILSPSDTYKGDDGTRSILTLVYTFRGNDVTQNAQDLKDTIGGLESLRTADRAVPGIIVQTYADEYGFSVDLCSYNDATAGEIAQTIFYHINQAGTQFANDVGLVWDTVKDIVKTSIDTFGNIFKSLLPIAGLFLILWGISLMNRS